MPLRHPAVALAKANRLKSPQNSSEVYKAHVEARLSQRLTDRQNDKTVSKTCEWFRNALSPCQNKSVQNKSKCFQLRTRNLWEVTKTNSPSKGSGQLKVPSFSSSRGDRHRPSSVRGVLSPCPERERSLRPSRRSFPNHPGLANSRKPQSFQSNACEGLRVVLGSFQVKPL